MKRSRDMLDAAIPTVRCGVGTLAVTIGLQALLRLLQVGFDCWMACTPERKHLDTKAVLELSRRY